MPPRAGGSPAPLRVAVLVSGTGTNLQALIDACRSGEVPAEVVVVVSNVPDAFALERARQAGIPAVVVSHRAFPAKGAFEAALRETLESFHVGLVCLAGFLRILSPAFVEAFAGRIMNIHPALLPAFGGKGMYGERVHEAVLASGARVSGCSVHFVSEVPDGGPIILQAAVPVCGDDTPATLASRVRREEHRLYPLAVGLFAEGRLRIEGNRVRILPAPPSPPAPSGAPVPEHLAAARPAAVAPTK
jgi:phosphoribosylglycinamide formyltransferase 1